MPVIRKGDDRARPGRGGRAGGPRAGVPTRVLRSLHASMLRIRRVEERLVALYPEQEMRCPTHFHIGQEAVSAGVCGALRPDDVLFCAHRSHAPYLAKGGDLKGLVAEMYGKATGCCKGKAGSQHLMAPEVGLMGTSAIVGGTLPAAVGAALAFRMRGERRIAAALFGDGGVEEGVFQESLNFAALRQLPVVFVCENNLYATSSHQSARQARDNIHRRGEIYGIPGARVAGNDVVAVYRACREAADRARSGRGPSLVECRTYRWLEHVGPCDDADLGYRTRREIEEWKRRCPVERFQKALLRRGVLSRARIAVLESELAAEIDEAVRFARESPYPPPGELSRDIV